MSTAKETGSGGVRQVTKHSLPHGGEYNML